MDNKKEISREEVNGEIVIHYDDGSVEVLQGFSSTDTEPPMHMEFEEDHDPLIESGHVFHA